MTKKTAFSLPDLVVEQTELVLKERLQDDQAALTDLTLVPMEHDGLGNNEFFCASVAWRSHDRCGSYHWIIKQWCRDSATARVMGISRPLEALAWNHWLTRQDSLTNCLCVPNIAAVIPDNETQSWLIMEDINMELNAFRFPASPQQNLIACRFILDRLACFHVFWESPKRLPIIEQYDWLVTQQQHIVQPMHLWAQLLGSDPCADIGFADEAVAAFRESIHAFLEWLPESDRSLWSRHMCDDAALSRAIGDLPVTLIHGDLDKRNIGLRHHHNHIELFLIDWEWIGVASPIFDVIRFINAAQTVGNVAASKQDLVNHYFNRYEQYGGLSYNRQTWQKAFELGAIHENLRLYPYLIGGLLSGFLPEFEYITAEKAHEDVDHATRQIRKWLT